MELCRLDPTSKVYKRKDGTYRCKNTGKNFNVKVGTIFENTIFSKSSLFEFLLICYRTPYTF